jgi:hypothetical protein
MRFGIEPQRHFGGLVVIAYSFIVFHIGCQQHFLKAMLRAAFKHIHIVILKHNLGINAAQANST